MPQLWRIWSLVGSFLLSFLTYPILGNLNADKLVEEAVECNMEEETLIIDQEVALEIEIIEDLIWTGEIIEEMIDSVEVGQDLDLVLQATEVALQE